MNPALRAATAVALLLAATTAAAGDDELEGLPILAIHIDRYNVFDTSNPKTSAWPYRWANALHVVSREKFIRSMLLFKEGDSYSASLAAESGRILRSLGIMNPVEIEARRVEGGVEIDVETHDTWSLQLGGSAGVTGNRTEFGLEIQEENLLGWGKKVAIAFDSDNERDTVSYRYVDPNVFNTRWRVNLTHADLSDGRQNLVQIDRPFYSLVTPWTWGGIANEVELTEYLYSQSETVVSGSRESDLLKVWGGARLRGGLAVTRRLVFGWEHRRDFFSDWAWEDDGTPYPQPEDRVIGGPTFAYEQIADNFIVVKGFRAWTVQEDVALGPVFSVAGVVSTPTTGGDRNRFPLAGAFHIGKRLGRWLILSDVWLSGRIEGDGTRNVVGGFQLGAAQLGKRGLQTRLLVEDSHRLDLDRQLTLGAEIGLRGWDPDYFDGTGRALFNIQWRTLIKEEVLGLFSVGAVVFADAGKTWNPRVGPDTDGIRVDAGVGLIFDLPNLSRTRLLRLDIAFPDDGSGPLFIISTKSIFGPRRNYR